MVVTNKLNLPQAIVDAVSVERHNQNGSYSATTLLHGACETVLTERYYDKIEVDAADSIWAIFGTAVHSVLEGQNTNTLKEQFYSVDVLNSKVTGRVDSYDPDTKTIHDYKTASVWKVQFEDFEDWRKQGLIYAWLMTKCGLEVKKCEFLAMLKDHSKSKAKIDAGYPQLPLYKYEFDVTEENLAEIETFINNRVAELEEVEKLADWEIKPCSKEERWATEDKFAVMKTGRKTAIKLFDTKEEAEKNLSALGGTYIEERKGQDKKCGDYCVCSAFCPYYQSTLSNN